MADKLHEAVFTPVPSDWKRKPYFDYYYHRLKTKYNINHHIDITAFLKEKEIRQVKFYPAFLYVIMRVINQHEEFRMGFDEENRLGIWNYLVPSYTIFHQDDHTFSDIWSNYSPVFAEFYDSVMEDMNTYKEVKKIKAKENQPANFCPISVVPWLSFQSISQDTSSESNLLFPIIRFGKYYENDHKMLLPFSIFVNHAVADGYHTATFINDIEQFGNNAREWMDR
ncbi:MAG TPA: chloramphenicol acetyltransferase CAT [Porphyromonadaceae bacterium]|jgi:chloramphenicol O-acetyltransferase type A|uniref:CatA-like O-acetyltransferase n=1 Tax=Limibacterium fermenti TaxID=3229863 RepID=UPI000E85A7A4|nr:chloramphenicol acetyltransferase CAT [Porphyromonadaceae bacterium]HBK31296.1 chloramphenicol acetyltransferase CAT [Porphyromonadaceae bacterium]HBL34729.1 chloramphenicol acetyltransferase CAT [Porphyromonadaceae bacterium]HBX20936.1 chloramphenicol acetyltransferase CAT [Porphyromonadaceae bacterium]HBX46485.1 chloramphenicol acetyltransferase CAT [Porphyromonadaceae bacterium]